MALQLVTPPMEDVTKSQVHQLENHLVGLELVVLTIFPQHTPIKLAQQQWCWIFACRTVKHRSVCQSQKTGRFGGQLFAVILFDSAITGTVSFEIVSVTHTFAIIAHSKIPFFFHDDLLQGFWLSTFKYACTWWIYFGTQICHNVDSLFLFAGAKRWANLVANYLQCWYFLILQSLGQFPLRWQLPS